MCAKLSYLSRKLRDMSRTCVISAVLCYLPKHLVTYTSCYNRILAQTWKREGRGEMGKNERPDITVYALKNN